MSQNLRRYELFFAAQKANNIVKVAFPNCRASLIFRATPGHLQPGCSHRRRTSTHSPIALKIKPRRQTTNSHNNRKAHCWQSQVFSSAFRNGKCNLKCNVKRRFLKFFSKKCCRFVKKLYLWEIILNFRVAYGLRYRLGGYLLTRYIIIKQ